MSRLLWVVLGALLCVTSALPDNNIPTIELPKISFEDIVSQDLSTAEALLQHLSLLGGLQITGIPRFAMSRKRALEDLAECLADEQAAPSVVMADGARRVSTGAAARRSAAPGEMDSECGAGAARLRASVDSAMSLVFSLLDKARPAAARTTPVMRPHYHDLSTLMAKGEHLEHLHAYYAPEKKLERERETESERESDNKTQREDEKEKESKSEREGEKPLRATLDLHVDAGLLIAMTTGLYGNADPSPFSGLYVTLRDDSLAHAKADEDALLVLLGDAGAQWLSGPLTTGGGATQPSESDTAAESGHAATAAAAALSLRALPHALVADLPAGRGATRSWYGKMYLPPGDALLPQSTMSFAQYHAMQSELAAPLSDLLLGKQDYGKHGKGQGQAKQSALRALLPAACGGALHSGRSLLAGESACPAGRLWCWARCMDTTHLPCSASNNASQRALTTTHSSLSPHHTHTPHTHTTLSHNAVAGGDDASSGVVMCWDARRDAQSSGDEHCARCAPRCTAAPSLSPTQTPTLSPTQTQQRENGSETTHTDKSSSSLSAASQDTESAFCVGRGVSMNMLGFFTAAHPLSSTTQDECVNLWFPQWTLDTEIKYIFACIGVFLMCFVIQWLTKVRFELHKWFSIHTNMWYGDALSVCVNMLLYGVNVTLGYLAMLAVMTYSVEMFCMVCLGLSAGFVCFHVWDAVENGAVPSADPCCPHHEEKTTNRRRGEHAAENETTSSLSLISCVESLLVKRRGSHRDVVISSAYVDSDDIGSHKLV